MRPGRFHWDMKVSTASIAQSGLNAASASLAVSANNVANASSTGFEPSRLEASEAAGGGVQVTISKEARAARAGDASGTDLVEETTRQISAVAAYRANLKSLQAVDDTTGVLLSLGGQR